MRQDADESLRTSSCQTVANVLHMKRYLSLQSRKRSRSFSRAPGTIAVRLRVGFVWDPWRSFVAAMIRPSRFDCGLSQIARVENGRIWKVTFEIKRLGVRDRGGRNAGYSDRRSGTIGKTTVDNHDDQIREFNLAAKRRWYKLSRYAFEEIGLLGLAIVKVYLTTRTGGCVI
jgi:hypothetical protein